MDTCRHKRGPYAAVYVQYPNWRRCGVIFSAVSLSPSVLYFPTIISSIRAVKSCSNKTRGSYTKERERNFYVCVCMVCMYIWGTVCVERRGGGDSVTMRA